MDDLDFVPDESFITVAEFLDRSGGTHYIPRIAQYLLDGGAIYGVDRWGRGREYSYKKLDDKGIIDALLEGMAKQLEYELSFHPVDDPPKSPIEIFNSRMYDYGEPFALGWDQDQMPDFDLINPHEANVEKSPRAPAEKQTKGQKGINADERLIGALVKFIRGDYHDGKGHHAYDPDGGFKGLAAMLDDLTVGNAGTNTTLERKLSAAVKRLEDSVRGI